VDFCVFRGEAEEDSGLKPNTFLADPRMLFGLRPGRFPQVDGAGHQRRVMDPFSRENPLPARRKSMRKIKEALRLRNELKLDQRQIARSCSISVSTMHEYLKRAEAAKVGWPLPEG